MSTYTFLRKIPLFADLPDDDLERLCQMADEVTLEAGQSLFAEGDAGDRAYIIREGEIEIFKATAGRQILLAVRQPGEVIGELSLLQDSPRTATARARTAATLITIRQDQLGRLLRTSPSAARAMFETVLARWRATETMLRQSEKMAQLGTLSAGIAHELNNPAAAVHRGADQLRDALPALLTAQAALHALGLPPAQMARLEALAAQVQQQAAEPLPLDALTRSDREATLEQWLERRDVPDAWELAPALVEVQADEAFLADLTTTFASDALAPVVRWLSAIYAVHSLLAELTQGAARITDIVKSFKSYVYLDQAPTQAVNVHEGLDHTLLILRHKLKGIQLKREYASDLPRIEAYGSELNQVWTNLLDNAADALDGKTDGQGEIIIRTRLEDGFVVVEVQDNGPGIPAAVLPRIFDPFFTTKAPGKGTGLGLDISYNIVVHKHRGDIKAFSQSGKTCFQVLLPVRADTAMSAPIPLGPSQRPTDAELRHILEESRTIAVVGISNKPERPATTVPAYLQAHGYRIIPVNPTLMEVLGAKAYPDLMSVPEPVDTVLIFRRSEEAPAIVEQAIQIKAAVVWMQEGIIHEQAADRARQAGLQVVMDTCMRRTHQRLLGGGK